MSDLTIISSEPAVVCPMDSPSPIAYLNIYENGDIWIKTKGCENCSWDNRKKCCGNCPMLTMRGCTYHLENIKSSRKPLHCVIEPPPSKCKSYCQLEFQCAKGSHKGQIRKVSEPGNIFH